MLERRFTTAFRGEDASAPGLILKDDGTVWLVNPDASETQLPGGGGAGSAAIIAGSLNPEVPGFQQIIFAIPFPVDPVAFTLGAFQNTWTIPAFTYAPGLIALLSNPAISQIDTSNDPYDISVAYFFFNADSSQYLHLVGSAQANAGIPGDSASISRATVSVAATHGGDLSYDTVTGQVNSAAGGTFGMAMQMNGSWD